MTTTLTDDAKLNAIAMHEPLIVFAVKVLRPGRKRWEFLTPSGHANGLRVHAARFKTLTDSANQARYIEENNVGVKAKAVVL